METISFYTLKHNTGFLLDMNIYHVKEISLNSHFIKNLCQKWIMNFIKSKKKKGIYGDDHYFLLWLITLMNCIKKLISIELSFHSWNKLYYAYNVLLYSIFIYNFSLTLINEFDLTFSFSDFVLFFTIRFYIKVIAGVIKAINSFSSLSALK